MRTAHVKFDDDLYSLLGTEIPLDQFIRESVVLRLFMQRRISSGRAAELLNMRKEEFLRYSSTNGVPVVHLDETELGEELRVAKDQRWHRQS